MRCRESRSRTNHPRRGSRSYKGMTALGVALCVLWPTSQAAQTRDAFNDYYHVQLTTTGCQYPAAVRVLTDPDQLSLSDARRLKSIRGSGGHCVTITPRSQWTFLWRENDVAMMSYAGRIGPPGSYYIKVKRSARRGRSSPGRDFYSAVRTHRLFQSSRARPPTRRQPCACVRSTGNGRRESAGNFRRAAGADL